MTLFTDPTVESQIIALRAYLEAGSSCWLNLFTNDLTLAADKTNPLLYVQPAYVGYGRIALLGTWSAPVREEPGLWRIQTGPWSFPVNAGGFSETLFGWNLQRGGEIIAAEKLPLPITLNPGRLGPTLILRLRQGTQSLICSGRA